MYILLSLVLCANLISSQSHAQPEAVSVEAAMAELRAGRPGIANDMFTQIIASKTSAAPDIEYHAAQAAFGAGYYRRAKTLIETYLASTSQPLLFADEANNLRQALDEAITASFTSDATAFEYAQKKNTIFAYAAYHRLYPEGANISTADFLSFRRAKEINVEIAYLRYLQYWPSGQYIDQAKRSADVAAFKEARHQNTLESYRAYLTAYPSGVFQPQAAQREEAIAFTKASKDGSVIAIKDFISRHPKGYNRAEAEKLLATAIARAPQRDLSGPTTVIPAGTYIHRSTRRKGRRPENERRYAEAVCKCRFLRR